LRTSGRLKKNKNMKKNKDQKNIERIEKIKEILKLSKCFQKLLKKIKTKDKKRSIYKIK